jgi:hypothetical protein
LVTTVIVVAVLAVVAVAFMQSTTTDRLSSRSVANYTRAKLAAEAGLAVAEATLARAMTNDTFIVVANTNRQLFVGNGISNSTNFSYTPAFSTVSNLSTAVSNIVTAGIPSTNVAGGILFTNQMPGGLSITSPVISWVFLTNASGQTNARFAYWVEDLGGRLDLSVVGTNTSAPEARRPTGTNPAEIALWAAFTNTVSAAASGGAGDTLVSSRSNILTLATARLVESRVTNNNLLADLAANLRHDTNEPEMIPFGLGYADQGQAKFNLNTNISAAGVSALAGIINANLPQFGTRGGAMNAADYVNNIAATIVDYADTGNTPTAGTGGFPAWRGVEAIPWPNEVFTGFTVGGRTLTNGNADWRFQLQLKQYVEVWNLSPTNVTVAPGDLQISNNLELFVKCQNWPGKKLSEVDPDQTPRYEALTNSVVMPANSYAILAADTRTFLVIVPTNMTTNTTPPLTIQPLTTNSKYSVTYKGAVVASTVSGCWIGSDFVLRLGDTNHTVSPVGFGTSINGSQYNLTGGDPRGQLFLRRPSLAIPYTNSSPGGRNRFNSPKVLGNARLVDPGVNWPDRGHSLGASGADVPASPATASDAPSTLPNLAGSNSHAVQIVNDTGRFTNITELGNIFDPIQFGDPSNPFHPSDSAAWMNLTRATTVTNFNGACGRNTLRIGRAEHGRFATNGTWAVQLLDLFAAGTNPTGPVVNRVPGRININTAGTNALRALVAGVMNSTDPALLPGGTNFVTRLSAVNFLVNGATNYRAQKPFLAPSQLATVMTNTNQAQWPTNSIFGNFGPTIPNSTNYYGNSAVGQVSAWNDLAAEEWFSRVFQLATVRSRNFLVYVVGEALQTNGTSVISTAKRVYQIYVEPQRATNGASAGLTTNAVPRVLATWDL